MSGTPKFGYREGFAPASSATSAAAVAPAAASAAPPAAAAAVLDAAAVAAAALRGVSAAARTLPTAQIADAVSSSVSKLAAVLPARGTSEQVGLVTALGAFACASAFLASVERRERAAALRGELAFEERRAVALAAELAAGVAELGARRAGERAARAASGVLTYLADAQLPLGAYQEALLQGFAPNAVCADAAAAAYSAPSADAARALREYRVPKLNEDGTCSRKHELEAAPFLLSSALPASVDAAGAEATEALWRLKRVCEGVRAAYGLEWFGLYLSVLDGEHQSLLKVGYVGEESRPLFPLTEEFAEHSNNSTVAMSGAAVIVQDTHAYEGPYYQCSGKVRSEFCLPLFGAAGEVIGIIDAECWRPEAFTPEVVLQVCAVAVEVPALMRALGGK